MRILHDQRMEWARAEVLNRQKHTCKDTHWLDSGSSEREVTTADRGKSTFEICYRSTSPYALLLTYRAVIILAALNVRIVRSTRRRCIDTICGLYEFEPHSPNM
jgi:hypothetical protein